jgi:PAS domain S-box-containing protein
MTISTDHNHLWKLLWEYDPNGLIAVDSDMYVRLVNPAFCKMFQTKQEDLVGQPAGVILDDIEDFKQVWKTNSVIRGKLKEYPQYHLYVRQVIFPIEDEGIIASIMVDISHDLERKQELEKLQRETIKKVNEVVDHQMKVVQEIASLLGETTAETKVSLLKIIHMLEQDVI